MSSKAKLILSAKDEAIRLRKQTVKAKEESLLEALIHNDMGEFIRTGKVSKRKRLV